MSDKKRVLVVDDEPDMVEIIQKHLEKEGFEVDVAYDGIEGLDKVKANPPDAIVLDVMMPEKDGYAVCAELKKNPSTSEIPVLMLTAVAESVTSSRYSHDGGKGMMADDYVAKGPDSTIEIVESVKSFLT